MDASYNDIFWSIIVGIIGVVIPLWVLISTRHEKRSHSELYGFMAIAIILIVAMLFTSFDFSNLTSQN